MISNKIKSLLKEKGLRIEDLANNIGYSRMGLTTALKSDDFKVSTLMKIAEVLNVPVSCFFDDFDKEVKEFFLFTTNFDNSGHILNHYIQELYIDFVNNKFELKQDSKMKSLSIEMIDSWEDFLKEVKPSKENGVRSGSFYYYPVYKEKGEVDKDEFIFSGTLDILFDEFINYTSEKPLIKWLQDCKIIKPADLMKAYSWVQRKS